MNENKVEWPIFHINCECFGYCKNEKYKQGYHPVTIRVTHGDLLWDYHVCLCYCELDMSPVHAVRDTIIESGMDLHWSASLSSSDVCAIRCGNKWQGYSWSYKRVEKASACKNCGKGVQAYISKCENKTLREFIEESTQEKTGFYFAYFHWNRPSFNLGDIFCSSQCAATAVGAVCEFCSKPDFRINTPTRKWAKHIERLKNRTGLDGFYVGSKFCSRECCTLAFISESLFERETRKIELEKKCVREVKKLLSKTKKSLREQKNQEALKLLEMEFAQVANLL